VFPNSVETGVAQLAGTTPIEFGSISFTTSFKFEIPGGPPLMRFGARVRISAICSGVFGGA
jgi:hypothetical protein